MKICVKVKPHSGKQEVREKDGILEVSLKSLPEDGKANEELIKVLRKHFKRNVKIKSGFTSRRKIIEVEDK